MAVLKGEGRVPILFGSWALPLPPNRSAYIARPDEHGEHPTVVIAHGSAGITPGVKALARHLARYGYSVLAPDLTRDRGEGSEFEWSIGDLADAVISADLPGVPWASASRIALLGIEAGGIAATVVASEQPVELLILAGSMVQADLLRTVTAAIYVFHGADEAVRELQRQVGSGEWTLYGGVSGDFVDESSPDFDGAAAADAVGRIVAVLDRTIGAVTTG